MRTRNYINMTDILFINPSDQLATYQYLSEQQTAIEPPLWCRLLASYMRGKGASVAIADCQNPGDDYLGFIRDIKARLVVVVVHGNQPSASTQTMPAAIMVCKNIKEFSPEIPMLIVGGHPATLPECTLGETGADAICRGEGFVAVEKLLSEGRKSAIGCYYESANNVGVWNYPAENLSDLRQAPGGCWDLLPMNIYRAHNWHCLGMESRQPYASIQTSLGCPHSCGFCLDGNSIISTVFGRDKKIKDISIGEIVLSYDIQNNKLTESTVSAIHHRQANRLFKIKTGTGEEILATGEHPIWTRRGWTNVESLTNEDEIFVRDPQDKVLYYRSVHSVSKRPEVRAKLSLARKLNNPMKRPEVAAKMSATMKMKANIFRARMLQMIKDGRMRHGPMSEKERQKTSDRMKRNNPMRRPEIAAKVAATQRAAIAEGRHVPFMSTEKGREIISAIAKARALNDNPMKNPAIALNPATRKLRTAYMLRRWQNPEQRQQLLKRQEANRLFGENHPQWRGGLSFLQYPMEFSTKLRRQIKDRDGWRCQNCGNDNAKQMRVHHIDYEKQNNDPCNLICVCNSCNVKANFNRSNWQKIYQAKMVAMGQCPHFVKIKSVESIDNESTVYNFECEPHNNFFANRILTHNCMIQSQFREGDKLKFGGTSNSYRMWPVESVLAEIETLVEKYGVTNIKIADEMFWLNPKHVLSICDGIIGRGWGDKLNIWCYSRVDSVRDEYLEKSRRAGIRWVALGIEALSDQVRDGVDKADYGAEDIYRVCKKIREHGINVIGNYIFGLPNDTTESMQATLDLAIDLQLEFANFYPMVCFPGSPLYDQMTAKGWKPPPWSAYSFHAYDHEPLGTETLSPADILRFSDDAFHAYFTNESYLGMVGRKFGPLGVGQIKAMTAKRLPRKLYEHNQTTDRRAV